MFSQLAGLRYALVVALAALCGQAWTAGPVRAQAAASPSAPSSPPGDAEYERLVKHALSEYRLGNFSEAYAMFRRAYDAKPGARPLRGVALALFELRRYVEAIRAAEQALAFEGDARPLGPQLRAELENLIERARAYVVKVAVSVVPAQASLSLDGQAVAQGELLVDPGEHVLIVSGEGYESETVRFDARVGQTPTFDIELRAAGGRPAGPAPGGATVGASAEAQSDVSTLAWAPWAVIGLGGASLVAGVVTGVMTEAVYSDIDSKCPGVECAQAYAADSDSGKTLQTLTNVFLVSGTLIAGAGVAWLLLRDDEHVTAGSGVSVAPACAPALCGVAASGRF